MDFCLLLFDSQGNFERFFEADIFRRGDLPIAVLWMESVKGEMVHEH